MLFVLFAVVILSTAATTVEAADAVMARLAAASCGNAAIRIEAPYTGDDNGDSSLLLEWAQEGAEWAIPENVLGSTTLAPVSGSFTHTIRGLKNGTLYQIRLTYQDPDGVGGTSPVQIINGLLPTIQLLHNSETTRSQKWSVENGWGITDGKYGKFSCTTCHLRQTLNIKRIKRDLKVTDIECPDSLPIEMTAGSVIFLNVNDGNADFGDDTRDPSTSSTLICEACHSQNRFHNYDISDNLGGTSHYNRKDCTPCHKHREAFKPACYTCHGDGESNSWPQIESGGSYPNRDGAHTKHVNVIAGARGEQRNDSCDTCHPGSPPLGHLDDSSAPARVVNMDLDGNGTVDTDAGSFKDASGQNPAPAGRYDATTRTCLSVSCHGSKETFSWYWGPDTAPPTWTTSSNITATDAANDGVLNITWDIATDAYPSNPVRYDLYMSTTGTAEAVFSTLPVRSDLLVNSATLDSLDNGQTYYFGVQAKDSAYTINHTANTDISSGAVPTTAAGAPAGTDRTYYGSLKDNYSISFGVDGNVNSNWELSSSNDDFARIWLQSDDKYSSSSGFRKVHWADSSFFFTLARLYLKPDRSTMESFPTATWVGPNLTSGLWGSRYLDYATANGSNTHKWVAKLLDYDPATGDVTVIGESSEGEIPLGASTWADNPIAMNFPRYLLPHGHLLTLEILVKPIDTADGVECWVDKNAYEGRSTQITLPVFELPADSTPPTWSGGDSGIAVQNTEAGGTLSINWNEAIDADSAPVSYDLYRSSVSAADVWNSLYRDGLTAWPYIDTGLSDGTTYYYGVRAKDSYPVGANVTTNTDTAAAVPSTGDIVGFDCTSCHGTPPAEAATAGVHASHADSDDDYSDCDHCHPHTSWYDTDHQNGRVELNFSGTAHAGLRSGAGNTVLSYYANGQPTGALIYRDSDGAGGMNFNTGGSSGDDGVDDGTCSNTGCHGSATPAWETAGSISCGEACHGTLTPRSSYTEGAGGHLQGSPPNDLSGSDASYEVGKHLAHLNTSYNDLGNSCTLCHNGVGTETSAHGDGTVQVTFHPSAGAGATWTDSGLNQSPGGSCSGLDPNACHGDKKWDPVATIACNDCHGFGGTDPSHVQDGGQNRTCTWCHPAGHPAGTITGTILVPNNPTVGIDYASGGIHLLTDIGGRGTQSSEAEICWSCHQAQTPMISEWGQNQNTSTGNMSYNAGTLDQANWIGAIWTSGTPQFSYKSGSIQSTHSANPAGTSALSGSDYNYLETLDTADNIRCSYCHDVHGRHLSWGGELPALDGEPYLRGTWKGNPYKEDGAPQSGTVYLDLLSADGFNEWGRVPRGSSSSTQLMGGYWIDQNSDSPTASWTLDNSAGLCVMCHSSNVDNMDQEVDENLWLGTNGHSNAVLGGTALHATNIFDERGGESGLSHNPYQHFYNMKEGVGGDGPGDHHLTGQVFAYRAYFGDGDAWNIYTWQYSPYINEQDELTPKMIDHDDWGIDADGDLTQSSYHQFSCSKCHNPHASRLPKLMITNCLDTKHNSWDNDYQINTAATGSNNYGRSISNWTSAQNCHRLGGDDPDDDRDTGGVGVGWNKVTPW